MKEFINNLVRLEWFVGEKSKKYWKAYIFILVFLLVQVLFSLLMDYMVYINDIIKKEVGDLQVISAETRLKLQTAKMESSILKGQNSVRQAKEPPKKIIVKVQD